MSVVSGVVGNVTIPAVELVRLTERVRVLEAEAAMPADRAAAASSCGLSPRMVEVLEGMAEGLTSAQIGRRLFLEVNTVKAHKLRLFRALGVSTSAGAVAAGFRAGVLS